MTRFFAPLIFFFACTQMKDKDIEVHLPFSLPYKNTPKDALPSYKIAENQGLGYEKTI